MNCPLCHDGAVRRFRLQHTAICECIAPGCGLLFADPQLDNESLAAAYLRHYYPSNGNSDAASYDNTPEGVLRQAFANAEAKLGPLAKKKLLDFGCGVGRLCQIAQEYGIRATGVEPDANAREAASKNGGLRAYANLETLREQQPDAKFDIVTMWDVVEHLREPWKELEELSTVLQPDGGVLLSTPNAASLRAVLQGQRWENMVNPTHFYYFTRTSLKAVLRRAGFAEITELQSPIRYPEHGIVRRITHRALVSCRLQGQLVFVANAQVLNTARSIHGLRNIEGTGVHAAG